METNGNIGNAEGNTKSSASSRTVPSTRWCFTLNNYSEENWKQIIGVCESSNMKYIIGKEKGESGTPHLQGYIDSPKKIRPIEKFKNKAIHWEKARGDEEANIKYCSKDGDYVGNLLTMDKKAKLLRLPDTLYTWQTEVLEIVKKEPSNRTINWYWEETGNTGKSLFVKYLAFYYNAILIGGKGTDILYAATQAVKNDPYKTYIFVFDFERSMELFVSYGSMEKLKNGHWFSGKYESETVMIPPPHILCFANFEPNTDKLSKDRWNIIEIDKKE